MHVPLLARTRSPTFYLYRRTIFLSRIILTCKIFREKFKTSCLHILWNKVFQSFVKTLSRLFQQYKYFGISGQSSSLKATGYKGYNLSIYLAIIIKLLYDMGCWQKCQHRQNRPEKFLVYWRSDFFFDKLRSDLRLWDKPASLVASCCSWDRGRCPCRRRSPAWRWARTTASCPTWGRFHKTNIIVTELKSLTVLFLIIFLVYKNGLAF